MKKTLRTLLLATVAGVALFGQKQPQVKSPKEGEALQALFNATDPEARMAAAENVLTKFADTEFKVIVLQVAAESAKEKNEPARMITYGERLLEADPNNYTALMVMAKAYADQTREFDLDKNEKLAKLDKYTTAALPAIAAAQKPNPQVTDDQWKMAKQQYQAEVFQSMIKGAAVRKKYDDVIGKLRETSAAEPDNYFAMALLGQAYQQSGKSDDAIATLDKVAASAADPQIKQFAASIRKQAAESKAKSGGAAAPAATPAPTPAAPKP